MTPTERVAFLRAVAKEMGWARRGGVEGIFEAWGEREGASEVLLPLNSKAGDFAGLLDKAEQSLLAHDPSRAGRMIREQEMLSEAQLLTTEWHKETPLPPGLIGWTEGETLYLHAREQLTAAAKATAERRRYHGNKSSYLARHFLDSTIMGLPKAGSYVVQALIPAEQRYYLSEGAEKRGVSSGARLIDPERTSGKEIVELFQSSLLALRDCLDGYARTASLEPFEQAVSAGVSYELTKSMSHLVQDGETAIVFAGPSTGPYSAREFVFSPPEAEVLRRATLALARDVEPTRLRVAGEVTLLSREAGGGDRVIRVDIPTAGLGFRKLRVRLTAEQYEVALRAHREEHPVEVSGTVEREGNLHWMYTADTIGIATGGAETQMTQVANTLRPAAQQLALDDLEIDPR